MLKKFLTILYLNLISIGVWAFVHPTDSIRLEMRGAKKFIVHRVIKGDALPNLASKYSVSEAEILSNNPLVADKIYPGQILKIPINETKYGAVTVPPVQSLTPSKLPLAKTLPPPATVIAEKKEVKSSAIGEDPIEVPTLPSKEELNSKEYKIYVVASPQTVNQLAAAFSVEPEAIIELNQLKNYNLKEGQKVKIPNEKVKTQTAKVSSEPKTPVAETNKIDKPQVVSTIDSDSAKLANATLKSKVKEKKEVVIAKINESKTIENPDSLKETSVNEKSKLEKKLASSGLVSEPKQEPKTTANSPLAAKMESKKAEVVVNQDSLMMADLKKRRKMDMLRMMDSNYIHPKGVAYRVFDYTETDYSYDLFSTLTAEENAIEVPSTNQSAGVGDVQKTHVVRKDETLQGIAKKYKVRVTDIINWNGLLTYRVRAGQELVINSKRADVSPYVRTLPQTMQKKSTSSEDIVGLEKVAGLAKYIEKQSFTRGVYTNAAEKGRFVYIVNRDNFKEHFARVIGPLPKGTPDDVVVLLDPQSAEELGIGKSMMRVFVYFGIVNPPTTEAKN
ncbi:MAG: LysM peptidoglycan-binding domain-containing protein [Bacteroidia bacterium]|nr:LysM peptidoglycan-binding domain-containing protein [Bacteroidia bacterium]